MTDDEYCQRMRLRLASQFAADGGWLTAGYVDMPAHDPVREAMLADGHIEAGQRDRIRTYELTDAGRAWCRENGIG